jgi:hypothetical protein
MLRTAIHDLRVEEPVPPRAGTSRVADLASPTARLLIEVKWIGKRGRWKKTLQEIDVDIQSYGRHPACDTLVFLVVDAARDIPDPQLVQQELSGGTGIEGRPIGIHIFIREP